MELELLFLLDFEVMVSSPEFQSYCWYLEKEDMRISASLTIEPPLHFSIKDDVNVIWMGDTYIYTVFSNTYIYTIFRYKSHFLFLTFFDWYWNFTSWIFTQNLCKDTYSLIIECCVLFLHACYVLGFSLLIPSICVKIHLCVLVCFIHFILFILASDLKIEYNELK